MCDDTCVIIKAAQQQSFLNHINSIDKNIQFTSEEPRPDGAIPFLDILLTPVEDGKITTSVFRKPNSYRLVHAMGQQSCYQLQI